jgi:hypothetical protein
MELEIEPPAPLDAAPRVLRLSVTLGAVPDASPADVVVVAGEVSEAHLRQLERDDISKALSERLVPAIAWMDDSTDSVRIILAPTMELAEGETYAVASGKAFAAIHFHVADPDPVPVLPRIWPPVDEAATSMWGLWCGAQSVPAVDVPASLAPAGPQGIIKQGIFDGGGGIRCVRFEATAAMKEDGQPRVGPPAVFLPDGHGIIARLDPRPFTVDIEPPPPALRKKCNSDELAFGPGCALVADDRLYGRGPEASWLWAVTGTGVDEVFTTQSGEAFLLKGLSPLSMNTLDVVAIDVQGAALRTLFTAATLEPMPHVILSEVQANPLGSEPAQEWVEIVNDGSVAANLGGYVLADIGGETVLPDALLPPSGYALIVNETFVEDDELDVPPATGTLLLRVSKLGLNGLSNSGEPLKLIDGLGRVVSRFPATPKPKPGRSVSRVKPDAPDGVSASFADSEPTPGFPFIH